MPTAEQFTDPVAFHGEGPYWDVPRGRLLHVDMLAGDVLEVSPDAAVVRHSIDTVAAVLRPRVQGGFALAVREGFRYLDDDLAVVGDPVRVFDDPTIRMNEGGCDPQGRFYCGTMAFDETPGAGTIYRMDPDGSIGVVLEGVTISNGIQWHAGGATVSYVDTPTRRVDLFDFDADSGTLSGRRPFVTLDERTAGNPDGTALDADGGLWVALFGGSAVHRYDVDGRLTEVVDVPVENVTACTFGGADHTTLYITTSRQGRGADAEAAAGAVFRHDTGVTGAALHPFAG